MLVKGSSFKECIPHVIFGFKKLSIYSKIPLKFFFWILYGLLYCYSRYFWRIMHFFEFFASGSVYLLNFLRNFLIVCQDCELYMSHGSCTNCIGTNCIGNKLYRHKLYRHNLYRHNLYRTQIVSGTNCIGHKLYRAQTVSGINCIL